MRACMRAPTPGAHGRRGQVYFVGVIDLLTQYSKRKSIAHFLKATCAYVPQ